MERGGKRSDPDFSKITIYMRIETRRKAAHKLIGAGEDLSQIVEQLVSAWAAGAIDLPASPFTD